MQNVEKDTTGPVCYQFDNIHYATKTILKHKGISLHHCTAADAVKAAKVVWMTYITYIYKLWTKYFQIYLPTKCISLRRSGRSESSEMMLH